MIRVMALWLLLAVLMLPVVAHAQATSEAAVKAAFISKFGAYVGWPASNGSITICAVGRDVLAGAMERAIAGQQIDGRPLVLRRMETVDGAAGCNIAVLTGSPKQSVEAALIALRTAAVLTVTDNKWSRTRGMIHFQIAANRVRFHIDDRLAAESGLTISSKLLALALSVKARGGVQ